jgi:hypothetical protein
LIRLPAGSFTVDKSGRIVASTLPQTYPGEQVKIISDAVLAAFHGSQAAQVPVTELLIEYSSLKLTARELRGGAIVFLAPRSLSQK